MTGADRLLSEHESKALLGRFGVPFAPERLVDTPSAAGIAATEFGCPVAVKLAGEGLSHKSERGLVRLGVLGARNVEIAAAELLAAAVPADGDVGVLVAPMIPGRREIIAGLQRDPQFGMVVLVGIGGVFAEVLEDVAIRLVPITAYDAASMLDQLSARSVLDEFRGEGPVDRDALSDVLLALSAAAEAHPEIVSADLNPLIISEGRPLAVDALVVIADPEGIE